ncbi:phosphoribosylanthranilate isomerase [Parvularcula sp. IMCC14364]|uniref:phosphoribosylanthranilate isomerase n=1 Tax=Parvularcula sp. IMCC14364 TaxID=3067902 RepID=UPI002741C00B|nr:phosphoribosylanthranilate isomerase [Parvularcula sp. IMCC14364]
MTRPRIKICCISSEDEVRLAVAHGANILGFVADQPSGPAILEDDTIRQLVDCVPPGVSTFLLTSRTRAADIADHVSFCGTDSVQIVRHIDPVEHEALSTLLPAAIRRIQVIHVESRDVLDLIDPYTPHIDAFLLDSGRPNAQVAEYGGTHDWAISADFVQHASKPVLLAGGLNSGNVADAISRIQPYGLDLCSGVRTEDCLDEEKLRAFMTAAAQRPAGSPNR